MSRLKVNTKKIGFFRFKELDGDYLLTNDAGDYEYVNRDVFSDLSAGKIDTNHPQYSSLSEKGFIRGEIPAPKVVDRLRSKNAGLGLGTGLHIIVVTLRCDYACVYCHASKGSIWAKDMDMDIDTAQKVVDRIFETPNQDITIEFQGGEPLLNFDSVKFIVEYAQQKNKQFKKNLLICMVTNLNPMNEEILDFLCRNQISICTSIDGPEEVFNKNRKTISRKNGYKHTLKWFKRVQKRYEGRVVYKPNALTTITKYSFPYYKEIIDEYIGLGLQGVHLRPLNPFGLARQTWAQIGYTADEFIDFYLKSMDYILSKNTSKKVFYERGARIFLTKILAERDPGYFDMRSPCGAGIGQLAYNFNGDVYTCDEARMLSRMGEQMFRVGNVKENCYRDFIESEVTKSVCLASLLDTLPGCCECVYKPYCGVCPIYNYIEEGNIFSQTPRNQRCKISKAILHYLFEKLKYTTVKKIFKKWVKADNRVEIA